MFGPAQAKKGKRKAGSKVQTKDEHCTGSRAGIRGWFGKGLEIKGSAPKPGNPPIAIDLTDRVAENATDLASDCLLPLRSTKNSDAVAAVEPEAATQQSESPVRGVDALLPAPPRQPQDGAAVRIQRWYRRRQAERKAAHEDVKDYVQRRRQADRAALLKQQTCQQAATDAQATARAQADAAKAAKAAAEKQDAKMAVQASLQQQHQRHPKLQPEPTLRDLREGLKQAAKADQQQQKWQSQNPESLPAGEQQEDEQRQKQSQGAALRCSQEENLLLSSSSNMQRDGLPSVTLSVSLCQSVQRGKCKSDTARKQGSAGQPEMSATSASTDAIPSAVGSLSTAAKASTGATETGLERGPVSTAVCFEQRGWQFQEPQCAPSAMHVQRSSAPKFPRLRPQAGCDVEPSLPDAATQPHFFKTSGTAAVTVGVAAAVRESLMLSAPADATLSSGLFEDFTREVAARIIQHYWREHVSRQMNPQDCINASIVPQPTMKQADVRTQLGSESNPGEAPGPERDQEDSLAVALMRYRSKDSIQAVVGHTPATVRPQEGTAHLQTKHGHSLQEGTATTAPAARASCGADSSFELARAIGKLKQRQGKQQRFEKPTAQHPKHALPASAELSEATKQDRSATEAVLSASAASGQQAQQAPNGGGSADHHTSLGVLTDSSNELRQEVSDGALLQILNPGWHVRGMAPPVNPPVSTGAMPLQQQLQKPNETGARNDASQPRPGSDENASPNLSPDKPQAQRRSSRIKQVEAVTAAAAAPEGLHHEPDPLNVEKQDHADHADHASDKASAVQETSYMVHSSRLRRRSDRLSSDKLADIFAFLDDVEARAEAEAADAVLPHTVHRLSPTGHQLPQTSLASIRHSASSLHGLSPTRHDRQLQLPTVSELQQNVDRPLHSSVRQPAHEAVRLSSALVSAQIQVATNVGHTDRAAGARAGLQIQPAHGQAVLDTACTAETVSTGASSTGKADKAALLAKSVYEGVRQRMQQLQTDVQERDKHVAELQSQLQKLALQHESALRQVQLEQQAALGDQAKKLEGDMARHLVFIDRLLADKDKLSAKCVQLGKDIKAAESKHAAAVESLKEGWVAELKRQKEVWAAAEKARRDTWLADKTKQVKELTVKGMEPEMQRLLGKHKAELQAEREKAQDSTRLQLDELTSQHEAYARQLRDRLLREQDLAVEREREAAQGRLREAAERYEGQMQSQRLRMVSDSELRLEQFQAERKDEKRRYEDALDRLKQGQGEQEQQLRSELSLEKAQLRRQHERELKALQDKMADEQEGWRLAVAKRAKEELASREAALRTQLMQERDHQLQAVVERLETEALDTRHAAKQEADDREAALKGRYQAALQAAQDSEVRHAERFRVAGQAEADAQQRNAQLQKQVVQLQQQLQDQSSVLVETKEQVAQLHGQMQAKEKALLKCVSENSQKTSNIEKDRQQLTDQVEELKQKQHQELKQVQLRVQTAVATKDDTIAALRQQLEKTTQQLKSTEAVLQQQQDELCQTA